MTVAAGAAGGGPDATEPGDRRPVLLGVADLRDAALALLDAYERAEGVSPADDYDDTPRVHPMAEAKYLLACLELGESGVMSAGDLARRARASLERLEASRVVPRRGSAAWGLGFAYRDLPADEPFTITTSMVLHACARAAAATPPGSAARFGRLVSGARQWLLEDVGSVVADGVSWPRYSPGLDLAAYNVAAYWAGALVSSADPDDPSDAAATAVAEAVLERYVPDVGWPYSPDSPRVDLVHTAYVAWGLLAALPDRRASVEDAALRALLQFSGSFSGGGWRDAFDLLDLDEALSDGARTARRAGRVVDGAMIVDADQPARAWSVGEALVVLAEIGRSERLGPYCRTLARFLASAAVADHVPDERFRHSMHVAHGLSLTVRAAREDAQGASS